MLMLIRGCSSMKRKIAAIFAADIAGYCQTGCRGRRGDAAPAGVLPSGDRRFHRQGRRPHFQYRWRRRARRISERGRSGALRDRYPGKPAHPQHGLSAEPADGLSHRHHDRRRGRARRRPAGRWRQHRSPAGGPRRGRRHLHLARGARAGRQQAVGAVRRYRRAGSEEHPDAGARLHGGDAARGRHLRDAAGQEARQGARRGAAELDVAGRGHGGQPGRDRRRRLSLFHQAGDVGAVKGRCPKQSASPAPSAVAAPPPAAGFAGCCANAGARRNGRCGSRRLRRRWSFDRKICRRQHSLH